MMENTHGNCIVPHPFFKVSTKELAIHLNLFLDLREETISRFDTLNFPLTYLTHFTILILILD